MASTGCPTSPAAPPAARCRALLARRGISIRTKVGDTNDCRVRTVASNRAHGAASSQLDWGCLKRGLAASLGLE
eukprot:1855021-Pyramimonas_sp.AAC.1